MKKTPIQISSFLSLHSYKSREDLDRILAISALDGFSSCPSNYCIDTNEGITVTDYLYWVDNGFGAGDVCRLGEELVICGICHHNRSTIAGKLSDDKILILDEETRQNALKRASDGERHVFMAALLNNDLQFSAKEMKLISKYTPATRERVIFTTPTFSGMGVVKEVHVDIDSVDFFCYYINETGAVGYSMDEKGITTLSDSVFEPMNDSPMRQTGGNAVYLQRKFNSILAKHGKTWNEKLHRIEPLGYPAEKGKPYWYINDKLQLTRGVELGSMLSRMRYRCGNYFLTEQEGLEFLGEIGKMVQKRLGSHDDRYPMPWNMEANEGGKGEESC